MKLNDWIVANITNPLMDPGDLRTLGLDMKNTLLLSKDQYMKSSFIQNQEMFKDANGNFSKDKFSKFYDDLLSGFKTFSSIEDGFRYDPFDTRSTKVDNPIIDMPKIKVFLVSNPMELTIGEGWINTVNPSDLSVRELAQKQKIVDYSTGQTLDYSPNDHSLLSNPIEWVKDIFKSPVVLATYDQDGTAIDPITGKEFEVKKGQYKMNSEGKYYYETLDGRNLGGKQVLSGFDTLTVDGEGLNAIDFFDSDDKEKSPVGSIAKSAAALAPMFIGGPIGVAYSAALVGRELLKTLPLVDGLIGAVTGNNEPTAFTKLANNIAGKMDAWSSDTSDYAMEHPVAIENLANLATDVALQWGLQKAIAKAITKLGGTDKLMADAEKTAYKQWKLLAPAAKEERMAEGMLESDALKAIGTEATWKESSLGKGLLRNATAPIVEKMVTNNRLGADASLMYMSLISNTDVYLDMLDLGLTKREAVAVTLGSTLGMFAVDKYAHLGELFFDEELADNLKGMRSALFEDSKAWRDALGTTAKATRGAKNQTENLFKTAYNKAKDGYSNFFNNLKDHNLGFFGKAFGEGIEEVSEELVTDATKLMYELAASWKPTDLFFGDLTTDNVGAFNDIGNDPEWYSKLISRYGMNFLGGFMGGGIFYAKDNFFSNKEQLDFTHNLVDSVRNYGKTLMLDTLEKERQKGTLGSTTLSANFAVDTENEDGTKTYYDSNETNISQNDFIANQIRDEIETISLIIDDDTLIKSDDQIAKGLTLGEERYLALLQLLPTGYSKDYIQRYKKVVDDYVDVSKRIKQISEKPEKIDSDKSAPDPTNNANLQALTKKQEDLKKELESFLNGKNAIDYMESVLFRMDDRVNKPFFKANFKTWLESGRDDSNSRPIYWDDFLQMSATDLNYWEDEYKKYKASGQHNDFELAWKGFKYIRSLLTPEFKDIQSKAKELRDYLELVKELFDPKTSPLRAVSGLNLDENDITDDNEDEMLRFDRDAFEELYKDLDPTKKAAKEKQVKIELAKKALISKLKEALKKIQDIIENSGSVLDGNTKRYLLLLVQQRLKDVVALKIEEAHLENLKADQALFMSGMLGKLNADLSNWEEIADGIREGLKKSRITDSSKLLEHLFHIFTNFRRTRLALALSRGETFEGLDSTEEDFAPIDMKEWNSMIQLEEEYHTNMLDTLKRIGYVDAESGEVDLDLFIRDVASAYIEAASREASNLLNISALKSYKDKNALMKSLSSAINAVTKKRALTTDLINDLLNGKLNWRNDLDDNQRNAILNALSGLKRLDGTTLLDEVLKMSSLSLRESQVIAINNALQRIIASKFGGHENEITLQDLIPLMTVNGKNPTFQNVFDRNLSLIRLNLDLSKIKFLKEFLPKDDDGVYKGSTTGVISEQTLNRWRNFLNTLMNRMGDYQDELTLDDMRQMLLLKDDGSGNLDFQNGFGLYLNYVDGIATKDQWDLADFYDPDIDSEVVTSGYDYDPDSSDFKNKEAYKQLIDGFDNEVRQQFNTIKARIQGDIVYDFIKKINNAKEIEHPIVKMLNKIGFALNREIPNIETLLNTLKAQMLDLGAFEFTLSDSLRKALEEAEDILKLAQSFTYAALNSTSYVNIFPHNQLTNEMNKRYKVEADELPVIDTDIAGLYYNSAQQLLEEIGIEQKDGSYTSSSWRELDRRNSYNKSQKFVKALEANVKAKYTLYTRCARNGVFVFNGVNLLENIDAIENSSDSMRVKVHKIEQTLYKNFWDLRAKCGSLSMYEYLNTSGLSKLVAKGSKLTALLTSDLDERIRFDDMTPMDRASYILSVLGLDPTTYQLYQADFAETHLNLAPLDIQQHVSRIGLAYRANPELIQAGIDWMHDMIDKQTELDGTNGKVLFKAKRIYGVFITGNGGAGKSQAGIRQIGEFGIHTGLKQSEIILTGPTSTQVNALKDLNVGLATELQEIISKMLGTTAYLNFINGQPGDVLEKSMPNRDCTVREDNVKLNNCGYKMLIVDEATHLSIKELSVLSLYAKQFQIPLILVGDNFLAGKTTADEDFPTNLNDDTAFLLRSPRLAITLRDGNILKFLNLMLLSLLMKQCTTAPLDDTRSGHISVAAQHYRTLTLHYYEDEHTLNGDKIVKSVTDEDLSRLSADSKSKEGDIFAIYIGSNDVTFLKLQQLHPGKRIVRFDSISLVQGQECDNIIVEDYDFATVNLNDSNQENILNSIYKFGQLLYTLSSRGKVSALFIDSKGVLLKAGITLILDSIKNDASNFDAKAIAEFRKNQADFLTSLNIHGTVLEKLQYNITTDGTSTKVSDDDTSKNVTPAPAQLALPKGKTTAQLSGVHPAPATPATQVIVTGNENNDTLLLEKAPEGVSPVVLYQTAEDDTSEEYTELSLFDDEMSGLVFGENTLSGLTYNLIDRPGKLPGKKYRQYVIPAGYYSSPNSGEIKDMGLILKTFPEVSEMIDQGDGGMTLDWGVSSNGRPIHYSKLLSTRAANRLKLLKRHILFGVPSSLITDNDMKSMVISDLTLMTKATYDDIVQGHNHIYLKVEEYNPTDNYVGMSLLSDNPDDMVIDNAARNKELGIVETNGHRLVFKLVARWHVPGTENQVAEITLGMLANPDRFKLRAAEIAEKLKKDYYDTSKKFSEADLARIHDYAIELTDGKTKVQRVADSYAENILHLINQFEQKNKTSAEDSTTPLLYKLDADHVEFTRTTVLRTAIRNHDGTVPTLRLEGVPNEFDKSKRLDDLNTDGLNEILPHYSKEFGFNFLDANGGVDGFYMSPIGITGRDASDVLDRNSMAGKCFVLVSSDPTINDDNAMSTYLRELKGGHVHSVRMLYLDTIGCSISELITPKIRNIFRTGKDAFKSDGLYDKYLFIPEQMAVRMLVNMWNFRANILNFLDNLDVKDIMSKHSSEEIQNALITEHDLYRRFVSENPKNMTFKGWAKTLPEYTDLIGDIWNANESLDGVNAEFRLGIGGEGRDTGSRNAWQIREIAEVNRTLFDDNVQKSKNKLFGIYITPDKANLFRTIIDELFKQVELLGLIFRAKGAGPADDSRYRRIIQKNVNGLQVVAIDSLEILRADTNSPVSMDFTRNGGAERKRKNLLKRIPDLIFKNCERAAAAAKIQVDENGISYLPSVEGEKVYRPEFSKNGKKIPRVELTLSDMATIFANQVDDNGKVIKDSDGNNLTLSINCLSAILFKEDLLNCLELCFHGTTDEFINKNLRRTLHKVIKDEEGNPVSISTPGQVTPQATDAAHRYGFYLIPNIQKVGKSWKSWSKNSTDSDASHFFYTTAPGYLFLATARIDLPHIKFIFPNFAEEASLEEHEPVANTRIDLGVPEEEQKIAALELANEEIVNQTDENIKSTENYLDKQNLIEEALKNPDRDDTQKSVLYNTVYDKMMEEFGKDADYLDNKALNYEVTVDKNTGNINVIATLAGNKAKGFEFVFKPDLSVEKITRLVTKLSLDDVRASIIDTTTRILGLNIANPDLDTMITKFYTEEAEEDEVDIEDSDEDSYTNIFAAALAAFRNAVANAESGEDLETAVSDFIETVNDPDTADDMQDAVTEFMERASFSDDSDCGKLITDLENELNSNNCSFG